MPWVCLLFVTVEAASPVAESAANRANEVVVNQRPAQNTGHRWHASLQAGAGMVAEDPAGVFRPRLGYQSEVFELTLGLPLWVRWSDRSPAGDRTPAVDEVGWAMDWRAAETYTALVERLRLRLAQGKLRLSGGALKQATLGHGALVSNYYGALDPLQRRTGARLEVRLETVTAELMSDSVVEPHLLAGHLTLAPLAWADLDAHRRFLVGVGFAVDPDAPGNPQGPVGGGELALSYLIWRSQRLAVVSRLSGAALSTPGVGGHLGVSAEFALRPGGREADVLRVDIEWVLAGPGYTPAYFDIAYQAERLANPAYANRPKRNLAPAAGYGLRGRVDLRLGGARFGIAAHSMFQNEMSASAYLRLQYEVWSAAVMVVKRDMREWRDLVAAEPSTYALVEAAVRVWEGWFVFSTFHHGWRVTADGPATGVGTSSRLVVTDWMAGIGYALGGRF